MAREHGNRMRIAQVAPLFESVPPQAYGGTERVVHYLTEELVRRGHRVTLFASGDSRTSATLHPVVDKALRLNLKDRQPGVWQTLQLAAVAAAAAGGAFDIVHFHTDYLHFPLWRHLQTPQITTLHGRLDLPDLHPLFDAFRDMSVVSISDHQRHPLPTARWRATVYNGIPPDLYRFQPRAGDYLAFLGRISPEKGARTAIDIALRAGLPLKMAAKVDAVDREYFDESVRPLLAHPLIDYLGEVDDQGKNTLLGGARALLFPIAWPEPFGLVMAEAMACGTPVIAFRHGSVPEIMVDGVTGFIVAGVDEALAAVQRIGRIDRAACRRHFERRFSTERMVDDYLDLYRQLVAEAPHRPTPLVGQYPPAVPGAALHEAAGHRRPAPGPPVA